MKEDVKKEIAANLLDLIAKNQKEDANLQLIVNYLPFFEKEIIKNLIDPILDVEKSFKVIDNFKIIVPEKEGYYVTFLEVMNGISSEWCIKKTKIVSFPERTTFLGSEGIELLKKFAIDKIKIKDKKFITFSDGKKISEKNYINGITTNEKGFLNRISYNLDTIIAKGHIIVVFSKIK